MSHRKSMFKKYVPKVTVKTLAKKVAKIAKVSRPEIKHVYVDATLTPPMSIETFPSTSVQHCVVVPSGVIGNQRIGNRIRGKFMNFRFRLQQLTSAQSNNVACRVMIVIDKTPNQLDIGLNPASLADLMQVSLVNGQYLDPINHFNPEYHKRFKILYDEVIDVGRATSNSVEGVNTFKFRHKRIKCPYVSVFDTNTTSGAAITITEGTYWLIYKPTQTENTGALVAAPQMHWSTDFFYTDA